MQESAYESLQKSGALQSLTWQKVAIALATLLGFLVVAKLGGHLVRRGFSRRGSEGGAAFALSKLLTYFLVVAGALFALAVLGLPLGSLLLTSSALLVGLGFGLQHLARDIVSGIVILVEQSIRKNDFVTFGTTRGTVLGIGLRSTQLLTRDGTALVVPNHLLTSTEVSNHSSPLERARLNVAVPVGFREDVDLVTKTLLAVADGHRHVLSTPPPRVRFEAISSSHFEFTLIAWVEDPVTSLRIASELRFAIARAFTESGIAFPSPELEIRTRPREREGRAADDPLDADRNGEF